MSEEGSSKTDPLTKATRITKRNLLAASVVAITFKAFDISADKIPVAGVTITYDRGVFEFLLMVLLCYFLGTFLLYYYIDIRNFPRSAHQHATDKWFTDKQQTFVQSVNEVFRGAAKSRSSDRIKVGLGASGASRLNDWLVGFPSAFEIWARVRRNPLTEKDIDLREIEHILSRSTEIPNMHVRTRPVTAELAQPIVQAWTASMRWLPYRYAFFKISRWPRVWTVASAYFIRNYFVDGILPIVVAVTALLALYDVIDVHALARLAPK